MEQFKKITKQFFFLPYGITSLIVIPSCFFVAYVLKNGLERSIYGILSYIVSAYALLQLCSAVYRITIALKEQITSHHIWKRYRVDFVFRTKAFLIPNTIFTLIFIVVKLSFGFYYQSIWMIALGIYYVSLLILRVSLLRRVHRHSNETIQEEEIRATRSYGVYLLLLDIALAGIVLYSLFRGAEFSYPGFLIYAMAAYTFYAVIMAIIGYFKNHRDESPAIITTNILKLTTALVTLFALETAMLAVFGKQSSLMFRQSMIAITGFSIVAVILGMALYLIFHYSRKR